MLAPAGETVKASIDATALGERMGLLLALPELRAAAETLKREGTSHETV